MTVLAEVHFSNRQYLAFRIKSKTVNKIQTVHNAIHNEWLKDYFSATFVF